MTPRFGWPLGRSSVMHGRNDALRILVVAPHADDETLGVGGTIARHAHAGDHVTVVVMTGHGEDPHPLWPAHAWDTVRDEARRAVEVLGANELLFREIPAVLVAEQPQWEVNKVAEEVLEQVQPDTLYVPFPFDMHRDHREIFHSFSVAWRPSNEHGRKIREIYAYEVPSETHWNAPYLEPGFNPNTWVSVDDFLPQKIRALDCYQSQIPEWPHARSIRALEHLARWRGSQIGAEAAEAFVLVRRLQT